MKFTKNGSTVMLGVHIVLNLVHPDVVTIVVPRHPQHGQEIAQVRCMCIILPTFMSWFRGELRYFYRLTPIAVIGGSLFPDLTGHNISEAAAAGCAVLTGHHVGHFAHMVQEMRRLNPVSSPGANKPFSCLYSEKLFGDDFTLVKFAKTMKETRDTAIKLFKKKIVLPKNGWNPSVSGEDFGGYSNFSG
ncbi:hypothetical protein RHGRI_007034 [Rhododendron griersonianum]|uniref:Uncharacterized protein n=1 Tax=Rhododendron griersonianum TaxID=479676 RepID=A0AAV6KVC2_9ERIC|nr:hypothetical protein RHGRI_007034 [Rhododendron griersonianum]